MRNPLSLWRPLFRANCGAQSLQWQAETDSSLTPIKPQCHPELGVPLPGSGNLGKRENEDSSSPLFALCSPQVAHPSLASNSGYTSFTIICPTCKAVLGTKCTIGMPGTRQCPACIRRRREEDDSLMPAGISTRHPAGHPASCQ